MATAPAFAATINCQAGTITGTANTSRTLNTLGTVSTIYTAGASGSIVERLTLMAAVGTEGTTATTAGMVRLFVKEGAVYALIKEIPIDAVAPSATVEGFRTQIEFQPELKLSASATIVATTEKGEQFKTYIEGGSF